MYMRKMHTTLLATLISGLIASAGSAQAQTFKTLLDFNVKNGAQPVAPLIKVGGLFYGTTDSGGQFGSGTVYTVNPKTGYQTVVHSFGGGSDGTSPEAGLIDVDGTLYGTTSSGGANDHGTIFAINLSNGNESVLYSFGKGSDGVGPAASLVKVGGLLYGTTTQGGANGIGTVFTFDPANQHESVLYSFRNGGDGAYPLAALTNVNGTLWGTTELGGENYVGTVFKINPKTGAEKVVYNFKINPDANFPYSGLLYYKGLLYGTTVGGGGQSNTGTVFSIDPNSGSEKVLHAFGGTNDGISPEAAMISAGNTGLFYGTTRQGGTLGGGTIFSFNPASGGETVLYNFSGGTDGGTPVAALTYGGGTVYGTTESGGNNSYAGTVFKFQLPN